MHTFTPQFKDLTEGSGICAGSLKAEDLKSIKTEFVFGVTAPGQCGSFLTDHGFKELACMNNWWPSHAGQERKLTFYWYKNEKAPNLDVAPIRKTWGYAEAYKSLSKQLASSGCGFKLAEPPISKKEHWRFFTLLRLPVVVSPLRQKLLKGLNYRHIDTGKLASYWLNGWDPETYSHEMEYGYFGISQGLWRTKGDDWLYYTPKQHEK